MKSERTKTRREFLRKLGLAGLAVAVVDYGLSNRAYADNPYSSPNNPVGLHQAGIRGVIEKSLEEDSLEKRKSESKNNNENKNDKLQGIWPFVEYSFFGAGLGFAGYVGYKILRDYGVKNK